ncbi:unnamed protein product [Cyclocybe aegerita]|uniref:Transmembrane protein n=1 Tax=Cyclocybe aegerita TaxID=1973307 RepID=A0A8S0WZU6_CYCAE|nr:unnamed protein product [Cyclocybe aegerita]
MISNYHSALAVALLPLSLVDCVFSQLVNVTLDETSLLITYSPQRSWRRLDDADPGGAILNYGGYHMVTEDPEAYANVTFTYVSFYFIASRYPYKVTTAVTIDGTTTVLDLQDHSVPVQTGNAVSASKGWDIIQAFPGTISARHTLTIGINPGDPYAVLDALMFEVSESEPDSIAAVNPSTAATVTRTVTATSAASSNASQSVRSLTIALGVVSAILVIVLLFIAVWCFRSRRPRRNSVKAFESGNQFTAQNRPDAAHASLLDAPVDSSTTLTASHAKIVPLSFPGWRQWEPNKNWQAEYTAMPQIVVEDSLHIRSHNTTPYSSDGTSTNTRVQAQEPSNSSSHEPVDNVNSGIRDVSPSPKINMVDQSPQTAPSPSIIRVRPLPPVPRSVMQSSPSLSQPWTQGSPSVYSRDTNPGEYFFDQNDPFTSDPAEDIPHHSPTSPSTKGISTRGTTLDDIPPVLPPLSLTRKHTASWGTPKRDSGIMTDMLKLY